MSFDYAGYNRAQQLFTAANVSVKNFPAVTTAATGLILYNPFGSGKKVLIADVGFSWTTAPAAVHNLGFGISPWSGTAPATVTAAGSPTKLADGTGTAGGSTTLAYDAATLNVAPVAVRWLGGAVYGSGVGESPYGGVWYLDGGIILVPGAVGCLIGLTTTLAGVASFTWAEVPA